MNRIEKHRDAHFFGYGSSLVSCNVELKVVGREGVGKKQSRHELHANFGTHRNHNKETHVLKPIQTQNFQQIEQDSRAGESDERPKARGNLCVNHSGLRQSKNDTRWQPASNAHSTPSPN